MNRLPRMYEIVRSTDGFIGSAEGFEWRNNGEIRVYDRAGRFRFFPVRDLEPVTPAVAAMFFGVTVTPIVDVGVPAPLRMQHLGEPWDDDGYPENLGPES